jgi:hypothetical protein
MAETVKNEVRTEVDEQYFITRPKESDMAETVKNENVENETTLPTFEYPEPRYFVDFKLSQRFGDERPRWARMPMMSSSNVLKLLNNEFYQQWTDWDQYPKGTPLSEMKWYMKSGVYDFRVQLEEYLDGEVEDKDGNGLGYTYREKRFGGRYQIGHEEMFTELGFDKYSNERNSYWDSQSSVCDVEEMDL